MKKILLFLLLFFIRVIAQPVSMDSLQAAKDTVNIHMLVQEQISKVQENQKQHADKPIEINSDWGTSDKNEMSADTKDILSPGLKYKFAAIILAIIISALYLVLKRKKVIKKNNNFLKKDISSVRKEKCNRNEINNLSIIRTNLKKNAVFLSPLDREISKSAKELKIAKGELYLAAELKSLELTKIGNKSTKKMEMI